MGNNSVPFKGLVLMKLLIAIIFMCSFFSSVVIAKKGHVGVMYYKHIFGNVHQNPSRYSSALTTISCGHPVKIYSIKMGNWVKVKVGAQNGYLPMSFLSTKRPKCFQDKYPRFFDKFALGPTDLYYWGRLYDQYVIGKSRVQ